MTSHLNPENYSITITERRATPVAVGSTENDFVVLLCELQQDGFYRTILGKHFIFPTSSVVH